MQGCRVGYLIRLDWINGDCSTAEVIPGCLSIFWFIPFKKKNLKAKPELCSNYILHKRLPHFLYTQESTHLKIHWSPGGITWWRSCSRITALSAGCLTGRSHRVQIFFSLFFALVYFSWKEMLQNSSHVTPEQKGMSERILSEVVFWLSMGQGESCKATLSSVLVVFSFHCGVVRACSSFN